MPLPIMTTSEDVVEIIGYLKTKATGVSVEDAKAAIDNRLLDGRKISAYKFWGILDKDTDKLALSDLGWEIARKPDKSADCFRGIIKGIKPYFSVLEWVFYQKLDALLTVDVVRHWSKNFKDEIESEETANDQAACLFRLCEGAELGTMKVGRRGSPTRLELDVNRLSEFITGEKEPEEAAEPQPQQSQVGKVIGVSPRIVVPQPITPDAVSYVQSDPPKATTNPDFYKRVYISHGRNRSFVDPIRKLLVFGELEAVVSVQEQSVSKPVPDKVMDEMRSCGAAIIHVDTDEILVDKAGKEHIVINQNVLIEIGAAMALYGEDLSCW